MQCQESIEDEVVRIPRVFIPVSGKLTGVDSKLFLMIQLSSHYRKTVDGGYGHPAIAELGMLCEGDSIQGSYREFAKMVGIGIITLKRSLKRLKEALSPYFDYRKLDCGYVFTHCDFWGLAESLGMPERLLKKCYPYWHSEECLGID